MKSHNLETSVRSRRISVQIKAVNNSQVIINRWSVFLQYRQSTTSGQTSTCELRERQARQSCRAGEQFFNCTAAEIISFCLSLSLFASSRPPAPNNPLWGIFPIKRIGLIYLNAQLQKHEFRTKTKAMKLLSITYCTKNSIIINGFLRL